MNELLSKARDPLYNYLNIKTRAKLASTSKTLHKSLQPELTKNRKLNIRNKIESSLKMSLAIDLGRKHASILNIKNLNVRRNELNIRRNELKKFVKFSSNNSKDWKRKDWEIYIMYLIMNHRVKGYAIRRPKDYLKHLYAVKNNEFKNLNFDKAYRLMSSVTTHTEYYLDEDPIMMTGY